MPIISISKLNKLNLFQQFFCNILEMKKIILLLTLSSFLFSCSDNGFNNKNPYLSDYGVFSELKPYEDINMSFYDNLKYPSNGIYYPAAGIRGLIIFNTGSGFNAFDAACPNQILSSCSTMTIKGINSICSCDKAEYSLFTGQSPGKQYPLKQYRVVIMGNNLLRVSN